MESRHLWSTVASPLSKRDYPKATAAKTVIEEDQRHAVRVREENGLEWAPTFFRLEEDGRWEFILHGSSLEGQMEEIYAKKRDPSP